MQKGLIFTTNRPLSSLENYKLSQELAPCHSSYNLNSRLPGVIGLVPPPALDKSNVTIMKLYDNFGNDNNSLNQIDSLVNNRYHYGNIGL
jgi:hypothetical protein